MVHTDTAALHALELDEQLSQKKAASTIQSMRPGKKMLRYTFPLHPISMWCDPFPSFCQCLFSSSYELLPASLINLYRGFVEGSVHLYSELARFSCTKIRSLPNITTVLSSARYSGCSKSAYRFSKINPDAVVCCHQFLIVLSCAVTMSSNVVFWYSSVPK